jgi:saccharopine dehydrogenase-like NADP-dependent oxidoreductase
MKILVIGSGGVGAAIAAIAKRRDFFSSMIMADIDEGRAKGVAERTGDPRFSGVKLDASDSASITKFARENDVTFILNSADPRFVMPIFDAAFDAGCNYLDMAMSLSKAHPEKPHELPGLKLGDEQYAKSKEWKDKGLLAMVGLGVEPGLSNIFARYAQDHLFSEMDEIGVRDGANLAVEGYRYAPGFSIWTTIEECLNPPVIWEKDKGWFTTPPFSEAEVFTFPEGIGPVECVNVEHEEVLMIPRLIDCKRVTFKYGLGSDFINMLEVLHGIGLDSTNPVKVKGGEVSPRDVVAACLPDPADLGNIMKGKTSAGIWVTGKGKDGKPREVYIYHVVDNEECMARDGSQAVVWQTAINPVVALELVANGVWSGKGVLIPEAFDPVPFLDLLKGDYESPWGIEER